MHLKNIYFKTYKVIVTGIAENVLFITTTGTGDASGIIVTLDQPASGGPIVKVMEEI